MSGPQQPHDDEFATAIDSGGELEPHVDMQPKIGRYFLLDRLGAGTMGTVFLAHDPELDRKVALKLLRGGASDKLQLRVQREAQAMAQLAHANVVPIYDVGHFGKEVFLAMEHLPGGTLADWLAMPRDWRAVLRMFIAAGRGLEAAHAAGLVHRDFKPANVLLSAEGAPKVTDFGLVRSARPSDDDALDEPDLRDVPIPGEAHDPQLDSQQLDGRAFGSSLLPPALDEHALTHGSASSSSVLELELTIAGSSIGTPAYMAPEQFRSGRSVDARSDQFSFCVALHEALWGRSPFEGGDVRTRRDNVLADLRVPRPRHHDVPSWLEPIVDRGLSPRRRDRWPSMTELLAALADDPTRRHRRWRRAGLVAGLALVATAAFGAQRRVAEASCAHASAAVSTLWAHEGGSLARALVASESSYALANLERIDTSVGDWVTRWTSARRHACALRPTPRERERQRCLSEQRSAFAGLLGVLGEHAGSASATAYAITAIATLPDPAACADPDYAAALAHPCEPALGESIHRLHALEAMGRYREGLAAAEDLLVDERLTACPALGDQALVSAARLALEMRSQDHEQIGARLRRAFHRAGSREDLPTARAAALALYRLEARAREYTAAQTWVEVIELLDENLGRHPEAMAETGLARLQLARARGELSYAREQQRELDALILDTLGAEHPSYVRLLVAASELASGPERAALGQRALDIAAQLYGREHPESLSIVAGLIEHESDLERRLQLSRELAASLDAAYGTEHRASLLAADRVGVALLWLKRYDEAAAFYPALLARFERLSPPDPLLHARSLTHYGISLRRTRELARAEASLRSSLELFEAHLGPDAPKLGPALLNLANVVEQRGRIHEAVALQRRALEVEGENHTLLDNMGMLELELGYHREALRDIRRAAELLRAKRAPEDPANIDVLTDLALAEVANDMLPQARARFEDVLERCEAHEDPDHLECAYSRGIIAKFLLEHPASKEPEARAGELERALELVERSIDHLDLVRHPVDALDMRFVHARVLDVAGESAWATSEAEAALLGLRAQPDERRVLALRDEIEGWLAGR